MPSRARPEHARKSGDTLQGDEATKSAERRREVIRATYQTIADKGFEGLRMREIARRAGMDHATLHYYFAGKEDLIHGVLNYIVEELSIGRNAETEAKNTRPRRRLAAHFAELIRQMRERPEMFIVLEEINARSMRDPAVRSVVAETDRRWKRFLTEILREGLRREEFQASLGPEAAAEAILTLVRGLTVTFIGRAVAMKRALRQLSRWLERK
jgi:AcrR family transcriptional regulator